MGTKKNNHTDPICFRCFESDFRWYFQWTFLKIKNVGKIKKNVKKRKKRALSKKRKKRFYIYGMLISLSKAVVSEMTYTVLSGTLNSSIPYHTFLRREPVGDCLWRMKSDLRLASQPMSVPTRYCLMTDRGMCEQLSQGCTRQHSGGGYLNCRSTDHESTWPPSHGHGGERNLKFRHSDNDYAYKVKVQVKHLTYNLWWLAGCSVSVTDH